jgi:hypothetical protein
MRNLPVICVILQIDGNTDGQNDTEFGEMQCAFFGMFQHEKSGVVVLKSAIKSCQSTGMPSEILVGITIDGEDGDSGRGSCWTWFNNGMVLVSLNRFVI